MASFTPHRHREHGYQEQSLVVLQEHVKAWHEGLEPPGIEQDASWPTLGKAHQREHEAQPPEVLLSRTEIRDLADCPEPGCGALVGQPCQGVQRRSTGRRSARETNHASRVRAAKERESQLTADAGNPELHNHAEPAPYSHAHRLGRLPHWHEPQVPEGLYSRISLEFSHSWPGQAYLRFETPQGSAVMVRVNQADRDALARLLAPQEEG